MNDKARVLIIGAGFGGIGAARKLAKSAVEVTLVDMHNYHAFQPMLYQVATDLIATEEVGHPLRDIFRDQPNLRLHIDTATHIDLAQRQVMFKDLAPIDYDYLVLGVGARVNFFDVPGAAEHAYPLYTLPDALRLKQRILERWEAADKNPTLIEDGALNVVVVGGGPTGVESAGAIIELYRGNFVKDYPHLPARDARVILVGASPNLLEAFKKDIQAYTKKSLEKFGVEVCLADSVVEVAPTRVTIKSGRVINAHTLVWGGGLQANPLLQSLDIPFEKGGRLPVLPDLSLPGHAEVFVIGDSACITDTKTKKILPQLGAVAMQSGELAGENIALRIEGKETKTFAYFDKGMMATIGRLSAVLQMPAGKTVKGKAASLAWGAVHLALLTGADDRTKTMIDWGWAGATRKRTERINVDASEK
jgi:NADH:ubiquinone reductase (H+-translocating)